MNLNFKPETMLKNDQDQFQMIIHAQCFRCYENMQEHEKDY